MEQKFVDGLKVGFKQVKAYFHSGTHINLESTDVKEILAAMINKILKQIGDYQQNGSGWYFKEVVHLEIHTVDYKPMRGSSYIPLPDFIMRKKAIINVQNRDKKCFLWSVLRYLHPANRDEHRLTDLTQYENDLNTKGIIFPVKLRNITKFEYLNPSLPGINVFSINEHNKFYPLRMAQRDNQQTIDLFLHEQYGKYHYSLIKNFSPLFRSQITSRTNGTIHICKKCFTHFSKQELYDKHIEYCSSNETVAVKMPPRNTKLCFKNYHKQLPIPFVAYADFECFIKPMNTCSPNPDNSYTYNYQKHEPSGFCLYMKGLDGINALFKPIICTKQSEEEDIAAMFVSKLAGITKKIYNDFYCRPRPRRLTKSEQEEFSKAEFCHICSKQLNGDKVRDHCHFTGVYRGACDNSCNLKCRKPMILPVIFHNLQGYDAHLLIKQLARLSGNQLYSIDRGEIYFVF